MRRFAIIGLTAGLAVVAAVLAGAAPLHAEDAPPPELVIGYPPACDDPDAASLSASDCAGDQEEPVDTIGEIPETLAAAAAETARIETALVAAEGPAALRKNCRFHAEVALYTSEDWNRLAQSLAAEASHCADYYISIPPLTADKTRPRPGQAFRIRALGPRFHAMAEAHLTSWQAWVINNGKTWVEAGKEFRKRMAGAGYDVALGDLWALNEVPSSVRQGTGQSRRNLLDFLRGLHEADGSSAETAGLVFVVGLGQRTQNLSVYLTNLRNWLTDSGFWEEAGPRVRFWAQEVYGDVRAWGVPRAPGMTRARHLSDYLLHVLDLAQAGGERTAAAETFLRRTYVPLGNAAWRFEQFFGFTAVDHLTMRHFISEQVFAVRHDAGTHPALGPMGRFGFAWSPENSLAPLEAEFPAKTLGLQQRLASALAHAYAQGGGSQQGACGPPGDHVWCDGSYEGAVFNDGWSAFTIWGE